MTLGSGGNVTLGAGGTISYSSGGNVTLGAGGNVTLGAGGTISLNGGGSVTIPSTGGPYSYTIPAGGGTVSLGAGGNVTLGAGGNVTLGAGGTIALGAGGNVTLGAGGNVTLGAGGTIALGAGGNVTLGAGGNVTLGAGGTIALGAGGNVTLGAGGNVTLGAGGTVTLGAGGNVTLGAGGNVTLGAGGTVTLGAGGNVTLGAGGTITLGAGGNVTLGAGGTITNGGVAQTVPAGTYAVSAGGTVALGAGGNVTLGAGGTVTLGAGGNVTLGAGGTVALGAGGNVTLGAGGTVAFGAGGNVTLGAGGESTSELTYLTANSVVRPPSLPTETPMPTQNFVVVNWTAPAFGVVQTYTISRSSDGATPIVIGSVSGIGGNPPATTFTDTNPDFTSQTVVYTIGTTLLPVPIDPTQRQSPPSAPAVQTNNQTIVLGSLQSSVSISTSPLTVTATAESESNGVATANGQQVNFAATGSCSIASQNPPDNNGVSSASVALNSTGTCTITASQMGTNLLQPGNPPYYNAATPVSGTFTIQPVGSSTLSQTILNFPQLPTIRYGGMFSLSPSSSVGLQVTITTTGPCTASGTTTGVGLCTITASAQAGTAGGHNYSAASQTQSFAIQPAVLTVMATSTSGTYGESSLPPLTYTTSPLVNGDQSTAVTGAPVLTTTATTASSPGSYPITVSTGTLAAANYSFLYVSGTLTIQQATPTISINNIPASPIYNGSFAPAYSYTGNGTPTESVLSTTTTVCTVSGSMVSFIGVGTCSLTASATQTTDYAAATGTLQSFNVGQATPTISINNIPASPIYNGSFAPAYSYTGNGTPTESVLSTTTTVCTVSGGKVTFVGIGTCSLTASATQTTDYAAATGSLQSFNVGQATPTISINDIPASPIYNGSFTPAYSYSGNGTPTESVTSSTTTVCKVSGGMVSFIGVGTCSLTASAGSTTDDTAATGTLQSFTVSKTTQSITFSLASPVTYGVTPIALSATSTSGLAVAFTIDASSTALGSISGNTLTVKSAGTLVIDANQAGNADYLGAPQIQRAIVVGKAALTVTANSVSRAYGLANPTLTASILGFVNGDTLAKAVTGSPSLSTTAIATSLPGSYPITVSQGTLAAANYTFNFVNGSLTVTFTGSVPASGYRVQWRLQRHVLGQLDRLRHAELRFCRRRRIGQHC